MKNRGLFIASIIMMLVASVAFANASREKHFAVIGGYEFDTGGGSNGFPFMGFDVGLGGRMCINDYEAWARILYQRSWQVDIGTGTSTGEVIQSSLNVGAEVVFDTNEFRFGVGAGFLHVVNSNINTLVSIPNYGLYAEGTMYVTQDSRTSVFTFQPVVSVRYLFEQGLGVEIGARILLMPF